MRLPVKKLICLLTLIFTMSGAYATNSSYTVYSHSHIELTLEYNYSYLPLRTLMEYKGIAEILNDHAEQLVKEGRLEAGHRICMHIGATGFYGPSIEMWRTAKYDYFFLRDWPGLETLARVIDYFAHPEWESLVYNDLHKGEAALRLFDRRLDKYAPDPDLSVAEGRAVTVYSMDDLEVIYRDGKLLVSLGGTMIEGLDIGNIYPVKFRDRYIVFEHQKITVYSPGSDGTLQTILTYNIPDDADYDEFNHDYFTELYNDWMNVYYNNHNYPLFSYCFSKNKFYTVDRKK